MSEIFEIDDGTSMRTGQRCGDEFFSATHCRKPSSSMLCVDLENQLEGENTKCRLVISALISSFYTFDLFTLPPSILRIRVMSSTASGSKIRLTELPTAQFMQPTNRAS